jgi:hypothetical protein
MRAHRQMFAQSWKKLDAATPALLLVLPPTAEKHAARLPKWR